MTDHISSEELADALTTDQNKKSSLPLELSSKSTTSRIAPHANRPEQYFLFDDPFYRSRNPKAVHWSIAWSDLMMTMFILFLTMFVYQAAHEDFLVKKSPELVGGSTTDAMTISSPSNNTTLPFAPIQQGLPFITGGTIKQVTTVTGDAMTPDEEKHISRSDVLDDASEPELPPARNTEAIPEPNLVILPDKPSNPDNAASQEIAPLDAIYDLSRQTLTENNLKKFASIDLIPDNTMRIILTGDLLFNTGKADLSQTARQSLQKVATAIKDTPYMINVIGHTDNLPMHSERFNTNWELSVARASTVARFLIEETDMNPTQFVVSGYSSFRPVRPNTNAENRAINRRVEIIISKKLPPAASISADNLNDL